MSKSFKPVPFGLFDITPYRDLVHLVADSLKVPIEEVQERLFREALQTGWNVGADAVKFGLVPHKFDERMEAFYKNTNAFVFELLVTHMGSYCQEVDRRVADAIARFHSPNVRSRILALGDGIGTDSLRFSLAGYDVSYFEFEGPSSRVAKERFRRAGMDSITVIHELSGIPIGVFDYVICREVLEHVPAPLEVISNIWSYLADGQYAIITESFDKVEPMFPTHLASNLPYAGHTDRLFVETGFRLEHEYAGRSPQVFRKVPTSDTTRLESLARGRGASSILSKVKKRFSRIYN